jgi:hypothetical protein
MHDLFANNTVPPTDTELKDLLGILIEIPNNATLDDIWPSIDRRILDVVHRGLTSSQNKTIEMIPIASLPKNDLENVSKLEELLKNEAFKNLALINNIEQSSISQTGFAVIPGQFTDNFSSFPLQNRVLLFHSLQGFPNFTHFCLHTCGIDLGNSLTLNYQRSRINKR